MIGFRWAFGGHSCVPLGSECKGTRYSFPAFYSAEYSPFTGKARLHMVKRERREGGREETGRVLIFLF